MLQDNVPAFDSATAMDILRSSLGKEVDEVFESFNPTPIAAASLGQVRTTRRVFVLLMNNSRPEPQGGCVCVCALISNKVLLSVAAEDSRLMISAWSFSRT